MSGLAIYLLRYGAAAGLTTRNLRNDVPMREKQVLSYVKAWTFLRLPSLENKVKATVIVGYKDFCEYNILCGYFLIGTRCFSLLWLCNKYLLPS